MADPEIQPTSGTEKTMGDIMAYRAPTHSAQGQNPVKFDEKVTL